MQQIEALSENDFRTEAFRALLAEAAGQGNDELQRIITEDLPRLETLGIKRDGELLAFAASRRSDAGNVLEYVAVSESVRGKGRGRALVRFIHGLNPSLPLIAETDDDAVGFYRRLGFSIEPAEADPRWPGRRRYRCVLAPITGG